MSSCPGRCRRTPIGRPRPPSTRTGQASTVRTIARRVTDLAAGAPSAAPQARLSRASAWLRRRSAAPEQPPGSGDGDPTRAPIRKRLGPVPRCRLPPSQRCGRRRMPRSLRPRPPRPVWPSRRASAHPSSGRWLSGQGPVPRGRTGPPESCSRAAPDARWESPAGQGVAAAGRRKVLGVLVHRRRAGHRGGRWRREHDDDGRRPTQATPASPKLNPVPPKLRQLE